MVFYPQPKLISYDIPTTSRIDGKHTPHSCDCGSHVSAYRREITLEDDDVIDPAMDDCIDGRLNCLFNTSNTSVVVPKISFFIHHTVSYTLQHNQYL